MNVPPKMFEKQLDHLVSGGWKSVPLSQVLCGHIPSGRHVVITFDDGYQDFVDMAWPRLRARGFSATCFVVPSHVGRENAWDGGGTPLMSVETLKTLSEEGVELGLHGWKHEDWNELSGEDAAEMVKLGEHWFESNGLPLNGAFAYPGGKFPRRGVCKQNLDRVFSESTLQGAFRIGSSRAKLPPSDPWVMCRIPIEGTDGPWKLAAKLRLGKIRL